MGQAPDFNTKPPTPWEGEDPSLWVDKDGHWHLVSHNGDRGADYLPHNASGDCGRHYFSATGAAGTWHVAPLPKADLGVETAVLLARFRSYVNVSYAKTRSGRHERGKLNTMFLSLQAAAPSLASTSHSWARTATQLSTTRFIAGKKTRLFAPFCTLIEKSEHFKFKTGSGQP